MLSKGFFAIIVPLLIQEIKTMSELIQLDFNVANEKEIHVTGSSTSFTYLQFFEKPCLEEMVNEFKQLIRNAKAKSINIKFNHPDLTSKSQKQYVNLILSHQEELDKDYADYQAKYSKLLELWKAKLQKGIYVGHSDDEELTEIYNLRNDIVSMFYRSRVFSKIQELNTTMRDHAYLVNSTDKNGSSKTIYF